MLTGLNRKIRLTDTDTCNRAAAVISCGPHSDTDPDPDTETWNSVF